MQLLLLILKKCKNLELNKLMNTTLGNPDILYPDNELHIAHPVELNFFERVWYCLTNRNYGRVC